MNSKKEVLIITAAPGVGKSTVSKAWANASSGAHIPIDHFSNWVHDPDFSKWNKEAEFFFAKLAATVAIEYLEKDLPVVIDYVWTPDGIEAIKNQLSNTQGVNISAVWLTCNAEENRRRDKERIADHQMKERVDVVRQELEACNWGDDIKIIDTTTMSINEVVKIFESFG